MLLFVGLLLGRGLLAFSALAWGTDSREGIDSREWEHRRQWAETRKN